MEYKGVNLACGTFKIPDFLNVDIDSNVAPDLVADIRSLPLEDGCTDSVYIGHGLEHMAWDDVGRVLAEAKRIVSKRGSVTVCVPNVLRACQKVEAGEETIEWLQNVVLGAEHERPTQRHNSAFTPNGLEAVLKKHFPIVESSSFSPLSAFNVDWQVTFVCKKAPLFQKDITVIIPTIRPENIPAIVLALENQEYGAEVHVLFREDMERIGAPKMVNALIADAKTDLVCFIGDDTMPQDGMLAEAMRVMADTEAWLVGLNDGCGKPTHWLMDRRLLNCLEDGQAFYEGYFHNFCDDELRVRADKLGKYVFAENAKIQHSHPCHGNAPMDDDYKRVLDPERWAHDETLFRDRCCKLSVCMIVKNEAEMLARCLDSVSGADEIVIVDTGSTDGTMEVARRYTDKVFEFPWCDDFAAARNQALTHSSNDWVLSIDADEILQEGGIEAIRAKMLTSCDGITVNMTNAVDTDYRVPRVFRNKKCVKWVGRIHEIPMGKDGRLSGEDSDATIIFTTSPAHQLDPDRNVRLLQAELVDNPENTRARYYLGLEWMYRSKWKEAIETFDEYLKRASWNAEIVDALYQKSRALWWSGDCNNGKIVAANCVFMNPNFKGGIRNLASMYPEKDASVILEMLNKADDSDTLFKR
jgi:glycosyltransferase involved in cell wall biosynthesis